MILKYMILLFIMENIKLLYKIVETNYNTKKLAQSISRSEKAFDILLVLLTIDKKLLKNFTLSQITNILNNSNTEKLRDIILYLKNIDRETYMYVNFLKNMDGKLKIYLVNYDLQTLTKFIDKKLIKVLGSYSKDIIFRGIDKNNEQIYVTEVYNRLVNIRDNYGIDIINKTNVGCITLYQFNRLTTKEKIDYYNTLVKEIKIVLDEISSNIKKYIVMASMFDLVTNALIKKIDLNNIAAIIEQFIMENEDIDRII